ncbi:MAG: hypothetical protein ACYC4N_12640 [Pirellulaceae bacterium]
MPQLRRWTMHRSLQLGRERQKNEEAREEPQAQEGQREEGQREEEKEMK